MKTTLILLNAFMFVLVGCSGSDDSASGDAGVPDPVEITLDLTEFAYAPEVLELQVGQVVTLIINDGGNLKHEIMFGRDVVMHDGKANGYETDMFEFAGVSPDGMMDMTGDGDDDEHAEDGMDHMGWMVMNPAGSGVTIIEFTVTADMVGEWEIACFEDDGAHYDDGMRGTLTVVEA